MLPKDLWLEGDELARRGDFAGARRSYDLAAQHEDDARGRWYAATTMCFFYSGDYAAAIGHVGGALRRHWSEPGRSAHLHGVRALCYAASGQAVLAQADIERAKALLVEATGRGATDARCTLYRAEGNLALAQGDHARARDTFEHELHALPSRYAWERSIALYNVGDATVELGEFHRGLETLAEAQRLKEQLEDWWGLSYVHRAHARAQLALGAVVEAVASCRRGLFYARQVGEARIVSALEVELARAAALRGDFKLARKAGVAATAHARQCGANLELVRATLSIANVDLLSGDAPGAYGRAQWAMETAERMGFALEAHRASVLIGLASPAHGPEQLEPPEALGPTRNPIDRLEAMIVTRWRKTLSGAAPPTEERERLLAECRERGAVRLEAICLACTTREAHADLDEAEATLRLLGCAPEAEEIADYRCSGQGLTT